MSENKRSRKYSTLKENKNRRSPFDLRDDADSVADGPKILLKPKTVLKPVMPAISIATRDPATTTNRTASTTSSSPEEAVTSHTSNITTTTHPTNAAAPIVVSSLARETHRDVHHMNIASQPIATATSTSGGESSAGGGSIAEKNTKMPAPLSLINDHHQLETSPLNYLLDNSQQFYVIGAIGTQGSGKSTLLNILQTPPADEPGSKPLHEQYIQHHMGMFATRRSPAQHLAAMPTVDAGIQMYVSADDRHIYLDCAPLLCNPYRKDAALSELDDLRLVAFMLSVCQTLLVVDSGAANVALLRLLQMAELMKPSLDLSAATSASATTTPATATAQAAPTGTAVASSTASSSAVSSASNGAAHSASTATTVDRSHFPTVLFVHNMADHWHTQAARAKRLSRLYANCFRQSNLRMFAGNVRARDAIGKPNSSNRMTGTSEKSNGAASVVPRDIPALHLFTIPRIGTSSASLGTTTRPPNGGHQQDMTAMVQRFRRWVLTMPRQKFGGGAAFSEKHWAQLVQTVWDSHKSSYFMRKYEMDLVARNTT